MLSHKIDALLLVDWHLSRDFGWHSIAVSERGAINGDNHLSCYAMCVHADIDAIQKLPPEAETDNIVH